MPEKLLNAHRIIFTGNFSPANNGNSNKLTCTIEFSGKHDKQSINDTFENLPFHINPLAYNYEPFSYIIQESDTRKIISELKSILSDFNIYISGRFAEWEYYNMDTAINASKKTVDKIQWL